MNKRMIERQDWAGYEHDVLDAVKASVHAYHERFAGLPSEAAYQVAIWTDAQALVTAVNFETKQNAEYQRNKLINYFLDRGFRDSADIVIELPYNTNPAGFKYSEFHTITHDNLEALCDINFTDERKALPVKTRFEQSLLNVLEVIVSDGLLTPLPKENPLWLGINSARDWYDHVRPLQF